ncbi:MAG: DUF488 domain-containing protein [Alphaproteobacteria bacterium]|nr:DUF488 domain-containing protein [Alphaproteobacteria bacterium]
MEILNAADVRCVADIRLWRTARFVPWASGINLKAALGDQYRHVPELAPTKELLVGYKDGSIDWPAYERIFNELLMTRNAETLFAPDAIDRVCLLCTEKTADKCHRRLVAEYLQKHFPELEIIHI